MTDAIADALAESRDRQTSALKEDRHRDADYWGGYHRALIDVRDGTLIEGPKF